MRKLEELIRTRFATFVVAGLMTVPVGLGALWFFTDIIGLWYVASNVVAIILSTIAWLTLHSLWTFRDREKDPVSVSTGVLVRLGGIALNTGLLALFTEVAGVWYMASSILAMCCQFPITYVFANKLAWRREKDETTNQSRIS